MVGRPVPRTVLVSQTGEIRSAENKPWMKFKALETYAVAEPAFEWSASLKVGGLSLGRAVDTLADGRGRMHVRLLGFIDVMDATGPEMDQGALMRWLNETMWFPQVWATGLIGWEAVDETSAVASLESNGMVVTAEFRFDHTGRLVDFLADRYREVDGDFVLTPWSTPISEHAVFDGVELPFEGAGVWALSAHDLEYVRIRARVVTHENHA